MNYQLKDSGEREEFPTGSKRDTRKGKGRFDLISPIALREIAVVYEKGAEKYGERNWEKGQPLSRFLDSALRHLNQVIEGNVDENHAAQAAWNIMSFIHIREMVAKGVLPKELNDLHDHTPKPSKPSHDLFGVPALSNVTFSHPMWEDWRLTTSHPMLAGLVSAGRFPDDEKAKRKRGKKRFCNCDPGDGACECRT